MLASDIGPSCSYYAPYIWNILIITHWGRVTLILVSKLTIIGSNNGLSPCRRQAIIWTNAKILLIRPLRTKFSEILIAIHTFSFKKMHLKMSPAKWWSICLGPNVLTCFDTSFRSTSRTHGNVNQPWWIWVERFLDPKKTDNLTIMKHITTQSVLISWGVLCTAH